MSDQPVLFSTFEAHIRRLDQADANNVMRLDSHIADYRREQADMKSTINGIDAKMDQVLENQQRIKGRDGVILVIIGAVVSVLCTVIAAALLGVIG